MNESKGYVAHDPVMIKQDSTFYLFVTGGGMAKSTDLESWTTLKQVPSKIEWVSDSIIPGYRGGYWAPDIQFYNGEYYLYYSPSAFAKNTSAIGVMTNTTLDQNDPDYKWVDQGMIVQSIPGRDFWNAIDANVYFERGWGGTVTGWLSFGSFWGGIKLVKLAPDMKSLAKPQEWHTIAKQERTFGMPDTDPGDGTIEAPFIYRRYQYYYLFVSLDYCCRGLESTYNVVVGRSRDIQGPYFDKKGVPMYAGGGTYVAGPNEDYAGIGHCAVYDFDDQTYFVAHGYDKQDHGRSKLIVKEISWDRAEWPTVKFDNVTDENVTDDTRESEWRQLFNGADLTGWKHAGAGSHYVEDSLIKSHGGMGLLFWEGEKFGNCKIRVVYRMRDTLDNSGVFVRMPIKPREEWMPVHYGYEVQIDNHPEIWGEDEYHYTGTIYSLTRPMVKPGKPGPEWNTFDITMVGPRTIVDVNGLLVTDYTEGDKVPDRVFDFEPIRGPRPDFGYIGLQNHDEENVVFFKEVAVRPLSDAEIGEFTRKSQ